MDDEAVGLSDGAEEGPLASRGVPSRRKRVRPASPPALRVCLLGGMVSLRTEGAMGVGPDAGAPPRLSLFRMNLLACSPDGTRCYVASNDVLYVYRVLAGRTVDPVPVAFVPFDRARWDRLREDEAAGAPGAAGAGRGPGSWSGSGSDDEDGGDGGGGRQSAFINLVRCGGPRGSPLGASVAVCRQNDCVQVMVSAGTQGQEDWGWDAWTVVDTNPPGPMRRGGDDALGTWSLGLSPVDGRVVMGSNANRVAAVDVDVGGTWAGGGASPLVPDAKAILPHKNNVPALDVSPCGRYVASASIDCYCRVARLGGPPGDPVVTLEVKRKVDDAWGWAVRWVPRDGCASEGLEGYMLLYATQRDLFLLEAATLKVVGCKREILEEAMQNDPSMATRWDHHGWHHALFDSLNRLALLEYVPDLSAVLVAPHAADRVFVFRICHASAHKEEEREGNEEEEREDDEGEEREDDEDEEREDEDDEEREDEDEDDDEDDERRLPYVFEPQGMIKSPISNRPRATVVGLAVCQRAAPDSASGGAQGKVPRGEVLRGGCCASVLFLDGTLGMWDISHSPSSLPRVFDVGDRLI